MDELIEEINAIDDKISQYELKIIRLQERKEELEEQLSRMREEQYQADTVDYQRMKL